jgi:hypothetical protein
MRDPLDYRALLASRVPDFSGTSRCRGTGVGREIQMASKEAMFYLLSVKA